MAEQADKEHRAAMRKQDAERRRQCVTIPRSLHAFHACLIDAPLYCLNLPSLPMSAHSTAVQWLQPGVRQDACAVLLARWDVARDDVVAILVRIAGAQRIRS